MKKFCYQIEALFLAFALFIFGLMPPKSASNLGGFIGRTVGPRLGASRKAISNIQSSFPTKTHDEHLKILVDMWDNLGRVMAEYPHLKDIILNHTDIVGMENLNKIGKDGRCIMIGSHLANWELNSFFFNHKIQWPLAAVYREPNNPYAAALLNKCRYLDENKSRYIPKSSIGARQMVKILKDGGKLGILIDQKYNKGLPIPFFGRPAMTSEAFAQLAQKYNCPILPIIIERIEGCHFQITIEPPMEQFGDDIEKTVTYANQNLEKWVTKNPGQWLWLHRRWDSKPSSP